MAATKRIPVTIVTGFLGAGKTSLIKHLLANAGGRRLALIINEFGDIGVDGGILQACDSPACGAEDIVELTNGCLCCTVADDFLPTLEKLLNRPIPPDHIVIETSGLALPKPLVKAFAWPEVRSRTTVDGVIGVVDGPAVAAGQFADDPAEVANQRAADPSLDHENPLEEVFEDQLACADLVIVNKSDLLDAAALAAVSGQVAAGLRPGVKMVTTAHGRIDPAVLLGLGAAVESDLANRPSHHEAEGEDHDHDDFDSFILDLPDFASLDQALLALKPVLTADLVLRVKGRLVISGKPSSAIIQGVGDRLDGYFDRLWQPHEEKRWRVVVIGQKGLAPEAIRQRLPA